MSYSTYTNESWHTHYLEYAGAITSELVMAHMNQLVTTRMDESRHTHNRVMAHISPRVCERDHV